MNLHFGARRWRYTDVTRQASPITNFPRSINYDETRQHVEETIWRGMQAIFPAPQAVRSKFGDGLMTVDARLQAELTAFDSTAQRMLLHSSIRHPSPPVTAFSLFSNKAVPMRLHMPPRIRLRRRNHRLRMKEPSSSSTSQKSLRPRTN